MEQSTYVLIYNNMVNKCNISKKFNILYWIFVTDTCFLSIWMISKYCTYLLIKDKNKVTRNNMNPSRFRFSGEIPNSLRNFAAIMIFSVDPKIALHRRVRKLMLLAHVLLVLSDVTSKCFANRCLKVLIKCFFACITDFFFQLIVGC